ncbi:uncharacterized protein BXZ73DRAFT_48573 [Epithele typhae]|uniref:uncharacterized protein n=1 Tax=Epithele typhae TaxID=378194 RepID=UPI00200861A3|nr:uncharacterized protein BXZ73DRAFT_48573 [Epithele typhae]KAH9927955.1 hypothetical protein BXZ73DRAFT_48573 [Epithele typhae]
MTVSAHPKLHDLRVRLRSIYEAIATFGTVQLADKPPILESSIGQSGGDVGEEFHAHQDAVHGLRALRDAVRRDLDVLEKFLDDPTNASQPALSTNAPYLISVWNEVLHAPPPIITIMRTFVDGDMHVPRRGSRKPPGVKVDVVADGGRQWIRVNTTKNSRLLAEFREIDSYMTDSEDEDGVDEHGPSLAQKKFDNSILKAGRALLEAASHHPVSGTSIVPSVTLRLTRLDLSPSNPKDHDPRIAQTLDLLRDMGIKVELGERDPAHLPRVSVVPARRLEPTVRVNLDLSILIALVSDITHAPLPASAAEADARYVPSAQYREWKRKRLEAAQGSPTDADEPPTADDNGKHSRALANQALQEMSRGLLHELHDRLAAAAGPAGLGAVEFWTTPEARDRCLRIVLTKIGGPHEKRRAAALFAGPTDIADADAEARYWRGSRYSRAFLPVVPVRVFPSSVPPAALAPAPSAASPDAHLLPLSPFFAALARTCRDVLAQETLPHPHPLPRLFASAPAPADDGEAGEAGEIERAAVTRANPRLTAHTVQSMLWGAARGWTTLTANKSSVRAILRDVRAAEGGYGRQRGGDGVDGEGGAEKADVVEKAAMWVVDPRSLAEGMRADYHVE